MVALLAIEMFAVKLLLLLWLLFVATVVVVVVANRRLAERQSLLYFLLYFVSRSVALRAPCFVGEKKGKFKMLIIWL